MGNAYDYSIILNHELMERNYREKAEETATRIYRELIEYNRLLVFVDTTKLSSLARELYLVSNSILEHPYIICIDDYGDAEIHKPLSDEGVTEILSNPRYRACFAGIKIKDNGTILR